MVNGSSLLASNAPAWSCRDRREEPSSIASHRTFQVQVRCSRCIQLRHRKSNAAVGIRRLACPRAVWPKDAAAAVAATTRVLSSTYPVHVQCGAASVVLVYAIWGLLPSVQYVRRHVFQRREWDRSTTKRVIKSYIRPLMLWAAVLVICRALDPVALANERSQAIKERLLNFLRSLSTVLTFAFCTARLTQQVQKFMMERQTTEDARNLGVQFIGNAVSTSVWVAAVCLFMELLGFSTQKWLTAGGFGTVLLTLAGREIFTNFLSSLMIHATRPFVEFEWIQTKIDGQDVSGTVELVGWWSPTVIRGEDREAVHIPNHKFTMSVVRNLTQKTHWRIKTHIGISHFDFNKINLIVADMRKVLSKHPHVEHKKLHRRVFFDFIDPVNQSLMIMVSCFVKTSHYEEYLSVKEIIMFNLLKVISYHNARLATPIRNIQRIYDEVETRNSPFRSVSREDMGRPLYLIDATAADSTPAKGTSKSLSNNSVQENTAVLVPEVIVISGEEERESVPVEETMKDRPKQDVSKALKPSSSFKEKQNGKLKAPPSAMMQNVTLQEKKEVKPGSEVEMEKVHEKQDDVKSGIQKEENPVLQHDVKVVETNGGEKLNPSVEGIKLKPLDGTPKLVVTNGVQIDDDPWKETAPEAQADDANAQKRVEGLSDPDGIKEKMVLGGGALDANVVLQQPFSPTAATD